MKHLSSDLRRLDLKLTCKLQTEIDYWINVLNRVCSVVKSLASHGLSFRGKYDSFESSSENNVNFVMDMTLIAEYDTFSSKHILKYGKHGKGHTSNISFLLMNNLLKL
ncbi:Hypothetical protein CINCED_3A006037 [Cinara cedri]|uniref:DUF4371 domain-containing protein n=1 Tax=Cinara cedri TaxID=506608 RepID=A0A5E4MXY8_9HEMI|nr:Hypothetical protein CINCED_3A006037 [Cinara cedri]